MAITLTGTGGLFTRLGKLAHFMFPTVNGDRGTSWETEAIDAVETVDADNDPLIREAFQPILAALGNGQRATSGMLSACRAAAQALLIRQVHADKPLPSQTLDEALPELIRQMVAGDHYVAPNTVGSSVTRTNLDGDGIVVVSTKDGRGRDLQHLLAEILECRVTGTATPGSERITVRGEERMADKLSWLWPAGSGASRVYTAIDAASAARNLVLNGGFEACTGVTVDDFSDDTGDWGTDWLIEETTVYKGSKSIELVGDGATLFQISQDITARVAALEQYGLALWARRDGSAAAAGVLTIDLYDGSAVIDDASGTANSFTIDLTALTESFVAYSGIFRLPEPKPASVTLRLRLSTALTNGRSVFFDHLSLGAMLPPGGEAGTVPPISFHSGATAWNLDDWTWDDRVFRVTPTNDQAGDWHAVFERLFDLAARGLVLPTAGSNIINDNLIA